MFHSSDFGDQVAFTVGFSYLFGFFAGLGRGIINGQPKSFRLPKKLIMNNFFNSVGKETSRVGNAFAAAGFMYYLTGSTLNMFFEDQLDSLTPLQKNMVCGSVTGAIFKSTLGVVPSVVGGMVGAAIIGGLTLVVEEGNRRGLIGFEMKF